MQAFLKCGPHRYVYAEQIACKEPRVQVRGVIETRFGRGRDSEALAIPSCQIIYCLPRSCALPTWRKDILSVLLAEIIRKKYRISTALDTGVEYS